MITFFKRSLQDLSHLFYPHVCVNCGEETSNSKQLLCLHCLSELPFTNFELHHANPVEKIFWGRIPVRAAMCLFYFNKHSSVQRLLHLLKYKGNKEAGIILGKMIGAKLLLSNRFCAIDAIIPLPLSPAKQKQRGYNQSEMIALGISEIMSLPLLTKSVCRTKATESQTHKNRIERWNNIKDVFAINDPSALVNKTVLLVDDVITTGATIEACGATLLKVHGLTLNIASVAYTI